VVTRLFLVQVPVKYTNVRRDVKGDGVLGDHVSRAGTSVRILALMLRHVSVRETSYLSGGKKDVHSCILALILGLECSRGGDLPVDACWAQVVHLLQASDSIVLVHYSSDPLDAVIENILLGVTSFPFSFPQMGLVHLKKMGSYLLDLRS